MRTFYAALPSARRRHLRQEIAEYFFTFGGTRIWTRSHRTPKSWKIIRAKALPCPCRMPFALILHAKKSHARKKGCLSDNLNVMKSEMTSLQLQERSRNKRVQLHLSRNRRISCHAALQHIKKSKVKGSLVPGWFSGNMMTLRDRFIMQEAVDMEAPEHRIIE